MKKLIDFQTQSAVDSIQEYANKKCNGNFNHAVRYLVSKGLTEEKAEKKK